ncbi:hypothetical protein COY29_02070 [Candidatus Woesebacteria bacterium CG_4_10_14_0_2_um_filter_39_14]|uniref:Nucleotidyl transferase AbiEii/AbiGii toxin family protein n=1 Tax=Candidatus Woesebacteria bacterium CG_4_10_14_0_2_um_filter_39_14 TaxID=1975054 RepID=A0A2M7TNG1_9BACT|nr:MAG: hypothetical protein COY29_02070 [Candidatus Woesebacteria bacterium CG_4_10_14_0_2_um_filter_39_14]
MSKLILESLNNDRLKVFHGLKSFRKVGILGGGTALSLQIGHRISYGFDIFTYNKLEPSLWRKARDTFGKGTLRLLDTEDQLNLSTPESVYVTFFYDDYKPLFDPIETKYLNLLDLKDIAANKAFTIGRRPKWRDYVDLYFLLKKDYISFENLITMSKKKFGAGFSEKLFFEQLIYWGDIEDYGIEYLVDNVEPQVIKDFLELQVKNFTSKFLLCGRP